MADIESVLKEERVFKPSAAFAERAQVPSFAMYEQLFDQAARNPEGFWGEVARELAWFEPWSKVLDWQYPIAKWFVGGKLNLSVSCLDRHLTTARKNKAALIWEGEPGETRTFTYQQLHREVCRFANV